MRSGSKTVIVFFLAACFTGKGYAAFEPFSADMRQMALSGIVPTYKPSSLAAIFHPAVLGLIRIPEAGISSVIPFGMKELAVTSFAASYPVKQFTVGISFSTYGFDLYRENITGVHLARQFFDKMLFGASVRHASLDIRNFGQNSVMLFDMTGILRIHSQGDVSLGVRNISSGNISDSGENPVRELFFEVSVMPLPYVTAYAGISDSEGDKTRAAFAAEIELHRQFIVRAGGQQGPSRVFFGLGLVLGSIRFEYSLSPHETLGTSHGVGFKYGIMRE